MHSDGQTSIDLLLTFMVALVLFSFLSVHFDDLSSQIEEESKRNSAKSILLDAYATIGSVKAYSLRDVEYTSPTLKIAQTQELLNCRISINPGASTLQVTSTTLPSPVEYRSIDLTGVTFSAQSFDCGSRITISANT
ncbi:MAG TPA: hypothetical protein VJG83_06125 [archaeon]|nr:hypothetical protein [archaeon]